MEINKKSIKKIVKSFIKSFILLFYLIFVGFLIIGGILAGIMTLIPDEASKPCYLGYYAHCSFAPYSTLILFAIAIVGTIMLVKLIKYLKKKYTKIIEAKPVLRTQLSN
ncbi:MAG: hypothetical protein ACFFB0_05890 [Promethearchaeota archaeon]